MGTQGDLHQDFVGMSTPVLFHWARNLTMKITHKGKIISKVICNFDIYIMMDFQICNLYLLLTILNMLSAEFSLKVCFVPAHLHHSLSKDPHKDCVMHVTYILHINVIQLYMKSPNYKIFITCSHICEPYLWLTSWSSSLQPASDWLLSQNCVMGIICSR
jgi:hypothetical protein